MISEDDSGALSSNPKLTPIKRRKEQRLIVLMLVAYVVVAVIWLVADRFEPSAGILAKGTAVMIVACGLLRLPSVLVLPVVLCWVPFPACGLFGILAYPWLGDSPRDYIQSGLLISIGVMSSLYIVFNYSRHHGETAPKWVNSALIASWVPQSILFGIGVLWCFVPGCTF